MGAHSSCSWGASSGRSEPSPAATASQGSSRSRRRRRSPQAASRPSRTPRPLRRGTQAGRDGRADRALQPALLPRDAAARGHPGAPLPAQAHAHRLRPRRLQIDQRPGRTPCGRSRPRPGGGPAPRGGSPVDVACRIGGDEFAVIMPESTGDDGEQLFRRVHNSMRGTALGPDEQRLRLSGGIAELLHGDTPASPSSVPTLRSTVQRPRQALGGTSPAPASYTLDLGRSPRPVTRGAQLSQGDDAALPGLSAAARSARHNHASRCGLPNGRERRRARRRATPVARTILPARTTHA